MRGSVFCGGLILCDIAGNTNSVSISRSTSVAGICHRRNRLFRDRTPNTVNVLHAYWMSAFH
jgi:hypothetical protein